MLDVSRCTETALPQRVRALLAAKDFDAAFDLAKSTAHRPSPIDCLNRDFWLFWLVVPKRVAMSSLLLHEHQTDNLRYCVLPNQPHNEHAVWCASPTRQPITRKRNKK